MYCHDHGCIISASNTITKTGVTLDYLRMAEVAATRVKHFLGIPTVLITSDSYDSKIYFDDIIRIDSNFDNYRSVLSSKSVIQYNWKNDTRISAYELSPFSKTLMIDADYFLNTDRLKTWLYNDLPFNIFTHTYDPTGRNLYSKNFSFTKIDQCWATAIAWDKSNEAKTVFKIARMVRDNYDYYASMFDWPPKPFRNDLAFTVASHLLKLYHNSSKNQRLSNLHYDCDLIDFNDKFIYRFGDSVQTYSGDLHVLNKSITVDHKILDKLEISSVKAV